MSDAPETLWVDPTGRDDLNMYVGHDSSTMDYLNMDIKYTRTDIAQARIDELKLALREMVGNDWEEAWYGNIFTAPEDTTNE
tara:strand:- start:851 stop:1096 length:246 start_codon:yes stop_codon:yes gene_type:complete